jgi:hypothetical protein
MTHQHGDDKVTVRVEVEVCGAAVTKKPVFTQLENTDFPRPWPADTPLTTISLVRYTIAVGEPT